MKGLHDDEDSRNKYLEQFRNEVGILIAEQVFMFRARARHGFGEVEG